MSEGKSSFSVLKLLAGFGSTAFTAVLAWLCVTLIGTQTRLDKLENDMSSWGTLVELKNKQVQLEIQLETMRRVWEYEYGRHIPDGKPKVGDPKVEAPPLLPPPLDPDQFRREQMQKYQQKK